MAHRGPDDEGIEILSIGSDSRFSLGLVHRRLSIIDLTSDGHQPMSNAGGSVWITFNGEIYNYKELRTELKMTGRQFRTQSDTEVILHAYEHWGFDCLQRLRGMFAFAIWDGGKNRLFMAVDRFGIKPLYYCDGGRCPFLFASEVRSILNSSLVEKRMEPIAVDSFLAYGAVQAPFTAIRHVYSLLPAHYLVYETQGQRKQIVNYWRPSDQLSKGNRITDETEAIRGVREVVEESIRKHLVSDVPVGLFLSGGIDSSSVVAIANRMNQGTLQSFSVTFAESLFSEEKYSQLIAGKYCGNHTEIKISERDLLNLLPGALDALDQPTVDGVNVYAISKVVRESGIKVVLSGQGGDEIFGGYSTFQRIPLIRKLHWPFQYLPSTFRQGAGKILNQLAGREIIGSKVAQIMESSGDVLSLCLILRQLFSPVVRHYLLHRGHEDETLNGVPLSVVEWLMGEMEHLDTFGSVSLLEIRLYLANMLLRDGDVMSMAHGLEVRVPFLDHEVAELVFRIDQGIKAGNHLPKPLLVKAMGDLLPEGIYRRPKMGFTFPWEIWLRGKLRSEIDDVLHGFPDGNELGLDMNHCRTLWRMFLQGSSGITWSRVWAIYVLLVWYKRNMVS